MPKITSRVRYAVCLVHFADQTEPGLAIVPISDHGEFTRWQVGKYVKIFLTRQQTVRDVDVLYISDTSATMYQTLALG